MIWLHNSVASVTGTIDLRTHRPIELSEGFTALVSAEALIGDYTSKTDPLINGLVNRHKGSLGFIILHDKLSQRTDLEFWRHCRQLQMPEALAKK
jgi:hypothetical protein